MKQFIRIIFFVSLISWNVSVQAQDIPEIIKRNLEATAETNGLDESGIKEMQDDMDYFRKRPINLNKAAAEDLRKLLLLTDLQIEAFIHYRKELGNLISIYELQAVRGWDIITIQSIFPYVTIGTAISTVDYQTVSSQKLKLEIYRTLERSKGYDTLLKNHFLGDPYGMLISYKNKFSKSFQFGFTVTKDPGEPFFKVPNNTGFDFNSFHLQLQNRGMIKNLVVGDYTVSFGQGLIYWQSLSFSKYADITGIKKQGDIIGAYRSTNEFNFKRGVAITIQKRNLEATQYISLRKISGHLNSDTTDFFTSLLTNGYHRTKSEIDQKNKLSLFSTGGNVTYQNASLSLALNTAFDYFSKPFIKSAVPYNFYSFSGQQLWNSSISYGYTYYNMHLFGEYAVDQKFTPGIIQGALLSLSKALDFSLLYRYLPPSYQSVFGKAFTENSQPSNENGLNTGILIKPFRVLKINTNIDIYTSSWLKYRVNTPSKGSNYSVQVQYVPSLKFELIFNYREKTTAINTTDTIINYPVVSKLKHWILSSNWKLTRETELRNRLELINTFDHVTNSEGFLLYLEYHKRINSHFQVDGRVQYIESPETAFYSYSNSSSISSLSSLKGTGYNYYIVLKYSPVKAFAVQVLFNQTIYKDRKSIGSGTEEIMGNRRSEAHLQISYNLN